MSSQTFCLSSTPVANTAATASAQMTQTAAMAAPFLFCFMFFPRMSKCAPHGCLVRSAIFMM